MNWHWYWWVILFLAFLWLQTAYYLAKANNHWKCPYPACLTTVNRKLPPLVIQVTLAEHMKTHPEKNHKEKT